MRVVITSEARLLRTPDGRVWTRSGPTSSFWDRYLAVFERVRVVARMLDIPEAPLDAQRVDRADVEFWPVPYYLGPAQYLLNWPAVRRSVLAASGNDDVVILRVPSAIGSMLASSRQRRRQRYALEVVGDPYDLLAPAVLDHPLRPVLRAWSVAGLRRQCRRAAGVAYVTEHALQQRYPAGPDAATAAFSSIELGLDAFVTSRRTFGPGNAAKLVSIGSLEQLYKGIDTLIEALRLLNGHQTRLVHMGDGRCRAHLEQLAARLGVADRVEFVGTVATAEVRRYLDGADLFVLPSRTEGLPRALIEAMARGLPAIATAVGGIPELLAPEYLVAPDDPPALASMISRMLADPEGMRVASARNLTRAHDFEASLLTARRSRWYAALRAQQEHSPRLVALTTDTSAE